MRKEDKVPHWGPNTANGKAAPKVAVDAPGSEHEETAPQETVPQTYEIQSPSLLDLTGPEATTPPARSLNDKDRSAGSDLVREHLKTPKYTNNKRTIIRPGLYGCHHSSLLLLSRCRR